MKPQKNKVELSLADIKENVRARNLNKEHYKQPFLWESILIHFHWDAFLQQFLIHNLCPFSLFLCQNLVAQNFSLKNIGHIINILRTSLFLVMLLVYVMMLIFLPEEFRFLQYYMLFPFLFRLMWSVSVSVKYASFSKNEYKRYFDAPDEYTSIAYLDQSLAVRNFANFENNQLVDFEIIAGGLRSGCDISPLYFLIENPEISDKHNDNFLDWVSFLGVKCGGNFLNNNSVENGCGDLVKQHDGGYLLSVVTLCKRINAYSLKLAGAQIGLMSSRFGKAYVLLMIALQLTPLFQSSILKHVSVLGIVFLLLGCYHLFFYATVVVSYFLTGMLIHLRRQVIMAEIFNKMIYSNDFENKLLTVHVETESGHNVENPINHQMFQTEEITNDDDREVEYPRLAGIPCNLLSLVQAQLAIKTFKLRIRSRLETTAAFVLLITALLMVGTQLVVYFLPNQDDKKIYFSSPVFIQCEFTIVYFSFFIIYYCSLSQASNDAFALQPYQLSMCALYLQRQILPSPYGKKQQPAEEELLQLRESLEAVQFCKDTLQMANEAQPVLIFGQTAATELSALIQSIVMTYFSTVMLSLYNTFLK